MSVDPHPASTRPVLFPYQSDAVERCRRIIRTYGGALLADDVGLGKTFVAAQLMSVDGRVTASKVIVPAGLVPIWTETARQFDLDVEIFTHDALAHLPLAPGAWRGALVVVDEAHHFRHPDIARSRALARLAIGTEMLLITATPVNNRAEDVAALVQMFASDSAFRLAGCESMEMAVATNDEASLRNAVEAVTVRRTAKDVSLELTLPSLRRTFVRYVLDERVEALREAIGSLTFPLLSSELSRSVLHALLERRLSSSPAALLESLRRMRNFAFRAIEAGSAGLKLSSRQFDRLFGGESESPFQDLLFGELWGMTLATEVDVVTIRGEIARLDRAITTAGKITDTKREGLASAFHSLALPALVFATARATARALHEAFSAEYRCGLVTGDRCSDGRSLRVTPEAVFASFQRGDLDLLIATDRASEGVNLQRAASVIHYDLPWNPVRVDQRNGRARRVGSERQTINVVYMLPRDEAARAILRTLSRKRRTARNLLRRSQPAGMTRFRRIRGTAEGFAVVNDDQVTFAMIDGALTSAKVALDFASAGVEEPMRSVEVDAALGRARSALESVGRLPAALPLRSPQAVLYAKLSAAARLDRSLALLLTRRYRRGIERELASIASGPLDEVTCTFVREMLHAEKSRPLLLESISGGIFFQRQRTD